MALGGLHFLATHHSAANHPILGNMKKSAPALPCPRKPLPLHLTAPAIESPHPKIASICCCSIKHGIQEEILYLRNLYFEKSITPILVMYLKYWTTPKYMEPFPLMLCSNIFVVQNSVGLLDTLCI